MRRSERIKKLGKEIVWYEQERDHAQECIYSLLKLRDKLVKKELSSKTEKTRK